MTPRNHNNNGNIPLLPPVITTGPLMNETDYYRIQRLQTFHELVRVNYGILLIAFEELTRRSPMEMLAMPITHLQAAIQQMDQCRHQLTVRMLEHEPGEECTLNQLINYAIVAGYQYQVITKAKVHSCVNYPNWAIQYRILVTWGGYMPCRLIEIPSIGQNWEFICIWLHPNEYPTLYRYFYYYMINNDNNNININNSDNNDNDVIV